LSQEPVTTTVARLNEALGPEFEVLRRLGEGATGTVWLARETALRRLVAIKIPLSELGLDPQVRARFEREARAAARLRHSAIAAIHRIARLPDGTPYLVMEHIDGPGLDDVLEAEGPFPADRALAVLGQTAAALAEAHAHGVLHRDVRPGNVLWVSATERAVLTDFGTAGILESGAEVVTRLTRPGELLGDPAYRSPEQLLGEPLTPASDIYGWGLLAFEVVSGQRPYLADTDQEMASAHLRQPPRSLRDASPEADPRLARLIEQCLAKEPRHRPSAESVARSLADLSRAPEVPPRRSSTGLLTGPVEGLPAVGAFLAELRRRRVYNVALGYGAIAFILLQGAELVLPELPLPPWTYTLVVAVTLAGFPVALVLAWVYDLTDAGIQRTAATALPGPRFVRWLLPSLGLLLSLALAVAIGWWVLAGA
jgi:eukaryotic-like serine/threonine-protein kinase